MSACQVFLHPIAGKSLSDNFLRVVCHIAHRFVEMNLVVPALQHGDVKLYDTDPRDAAMIMAIVADKLQKPLNELRFVSIKEVK